MWTNDVRSHFRSRTRRSSGTVSAGLDLTARNLLSDGNLVQDVDHDVLEHHAQCTLIEAVAVHEGRQRNLCLEGPQRPGNSKEVWDVLLDRHVNPSVGNHVPFGVERDGTYASGPQGGHVDLDVIQAV